jgi:hypothetical protein
MNGFSELILDFFASDIGRYSRTAAGLAGLPLDFAVEVEAELMTTIL